jgi:hypothetical protein
MQPVIQNSRANQFLLSDYPSHDWYRFVLSYPPHLVREYLARFAIQPHQRVLDPFCGTGTTVVECKKHGFSAEGIEANPVAHFACRVKTDWSMDAQSLLEIAEAVAAETRRLLEAQGINDDAHSVLFAHNTPPSTALLDLSPEAKALLLKDSISPLPLHKALTLLAQIDAHADTHWRDYARLALAHVLVYSAGNLHFGPEVGIGKIKIDSPVIVPWLARMRQIASDLHALHPLAATPTYVHHGDSRDVAHILTPNSIDAVITSPPYPNEKDYTRTTRLEAVVLGFIESKAQLRAMKQGLLRSNTRNVYVHDTDDAWIANFPQIHEIADTIERRRIELGKDSGFERMYARTTKLYFGGMARHLAELRPFLRHGARLAYVVGDQASYLRVMIRTGQLLADIARSLGYEVVGIDLFRTRLATATREQLREEVLVLRWDG